VGCADKERKRNSSMWRDKEREINPFVKRTQCREVGREKEG
jgi:hypothetical protein